LSDAERLARTPVVLSTSSVYPDRTPDAFEAAVRLGYDGIEVMVYTDPVSQDVDVIKRLIDYHQLPVLAVHAPSLLLTQRVWGREPWEKIRRSQDMAEQLGARIVVVHPPFRWQRDYAVDFETGLAAMEAETDIIFAVENMFPLRARGREIAPYAPSWDPTTINCANVTIDLSHAAASGSDALAMAEAVGDRLAHVHLADGTGTPNGPFPDEHLVPGRGSQPCAEFLHRLGATGWSGAVVLEVNTRRAPSRDAREADLAESLAFAREHLTHVPAR
jgi:sugar phosphate isomerase/epimerase